MKKSVPSQDGTVIPPILILCNLVCMQRSAWGRNTWIDLPTHQCLLGVCTSDPTRPWAKRAKHWKLLQHVGLGLPGGFARNFNMWGGVGWGGVCQRWCSCVHMVRCWCVDVYTWYAAGVFMCTHGALLVCWCVHMVRCWCVHVYTWYAAGVSCANVSRNRSVMIGFNVFLLAMCLLSVWLFLFTSGVCDIYICMYVYFMSVYICMQIVSSGNAVNYRWLLIFPPDLAEKTQVWTLSKHSMINCIWKKDMKSTCEQLHFIWKTQ